MIEEPTRKIKKSSEADRIRAAKWISEHSERYRTYQMEYVKKNREARNKKERERYARDHPNFKRTSKYRKKENGKVILTEKPVFVIKEKPIKKKKTPKSVETFTSNPSVIAHVKWLQEHSKQN